MKSISINEIPNIYNKKSVWVWVESGHSKMLKLIALSHEWKEYNLKKEVLKKLYSKVNWVVGASHLKTEWT